MPWQEFSSDIGTLGTPSHVIDVNNILCAYVSPERSTVDTMGLRSLRQLDVLHTCIPIHVFDRHVRKAQVMKQMFFKRNIS